MRKGLAKEQVIYIEHLKQRVFDFFEEVPGPKLGGPGRFFQGKKNSCLRCSIYTTSFDRMTPMRSMNLSHLAIKFKYC